MRKRYQIKNFNFKLVLFTLALAIIGIFAVGSADASLQNKQLWGVVAGVFIMFLLALFNYSFLLKFYWVYYVAGVIILIMVIMLGQKGNGAQRWFTILGVRFQPSELIKVVMIICIAAFINRHHEELNSFKTIAISIAMFGILAGLVFAQPDLSTTIVLCLIFATIMFTADLSWRVIIGIVAVGIPIVLIALYLIMQPEQNLISDYQKSRIMSFFNKEETANNEGYQQTYSVLAIGSGQLDGKGYKNNEIYSVKNADFIAEQQTDFIFAVIGEEFGFIGTCSVIILLFLISFECFMTGFRAKDVAGRMIGSGVGAWIGFQGFINIGVVTYLLPNTGLPLPFVSYGLTSLISLFIGIGFVLNVGLQCDVK